MEEYATKKDISDIHEAIKSFREEMKGDFQDVLEVISTFATHTEEEFADVKHEMGVIKQDVNCLKQDVNQIKASIVTKAYLDDKLADLRGDLTNYDRKQDKKVDFLARTLERKKLLTTKEADAVILMSAFSQAPKVK